MPKFESPNEHQSFAYFVQEGAEIVSTFLPSSAEFWCHIGPRISHAFPSVKHGITAVGAIQSQLQHLSPTQVVESRYPEHSPLSLANLARGLRLASIADPRATPLEVTLTTCIYFTAASIWTEKIGAPSLHTAAGLRLLAEYDRGQYQGLVANKEEIETVFRPLFHRFTVAACTFGDDFPSATSDMPQNYLLDIDLDKVGDFNRAVEGFEAVGTLLKCVLRLREGVTMDNILPRVSAAIDLCDDTLNSVYLKSSAQEASPTGNTLDYDYHHLRMHLATIRIMFGTIQVRDETEYDAFRNVFQFILVESKQLLNNDTPLAAKTYQGRILRTTHGVIPPLFLTATKCRDLNIRRQAVTLLHSYGHAERGWTSCMAVSLANFVIEREHGRDAEGVLLDPVRNRIRLESVKFSSKLKTTFVDYWDYSNILSAPSTELGSAANTPMSGALTSPTVDGPMLRSAAIPFQPCGAVERQGETAEMARKVLHAFGHTGVVLYVPKIACHCV